MTLDASVKIYGSRVDSVHTIAFQTLSGLNRSGGATDGGAILAHRCVAMLPQIICESMSICTMHTEEAPVTDMYPA